MTSRARPGGRGPIVFRLPVSVSCKATRGRDRQCRVSSGRQWPPPGFRVLAGQLPKFRAASECDSGPPVRLPRLRLRVSVTVPSRELEIFTFFTLLSSQGQ
eukprot:266272-Hanusia_phi.AAC.2